MMLRFHTHENFVFLFISVYLYVVCCKIGFRLESVSDRVRNKSTVSISSTRILSVLNGNCTTFTKGVGHVGR